MTGGPVHDKPQSRSRRAGRALEQFPDEGIARLQVSAPRPEVHSDGTPVNFGSVQVWRIAEWNYIDWSRVESEQWKGLVVAAAKAARDRMDQSQAHLWTVLDLVSLGLLYYVESGDEVRLSVEDVTRGILDATRTRYRGMSARDRAALDRDEPETVPATQVVRDPQWREGDAPGYSGRRRSPAGVGDPTFRTTSTRDRLARLWHAADLSQRESDWLWWECVEGYTQADIARAEDVDPSTVSYAITRALAKLHQAARR